MAARTTRQAARAQLRQIFETELDLLIPPDEQTPLKGRLFVDFEDQVEKLVSTVGRVALRERAALDGKAAVAEGGRCPYCGSDSIYLEKQETQPLLISPHGPLRLAQQQARCRRCDGSFSPASARLGFARRSAAYPPRLPACGAGSNRARL